MMKDMDSSSIGLAKDVVAGTLVLGGVVATVVAAEASLPMVAMIGALTAVGSGAYQAITAPKRTGNHPKGW